ncbi:SUKH-3 domain-containing protein [Streptomyces sp. NPDC002104]
MTADITPNTRNSPNTPKATGGESAMGREQAAMLAVLEVGALGWEPFPTAVEALRAWYGVRVDPTGAGLAVAPTGAVVDPREAQYTAGTFHALAGHVGLRLFPFGRTTADAPLAVDELGRLFTVDHGGFRLLGESVADGLSALTEGRMPVRLAARRGSWPLGPFRPEDRIAEALRVGLTAVYVLHRHGAYSARALQLRATTLRGIGAVALDRSFPLPRGSLEASAGPLAHAMAEALAIAGVPVAGAELRLSIPPPPTSTGPLSTFDCALTLGASALHPTAASLTLTAGPGSSVGPSAEVFDACSADFSRIWQAPGAPDILPEPAAR